MSGKQRLKSERIVRSCRSDAWSRSKSAGVAALPMEGEKAAHASCLPASSDAGGRTWSKPGASRASGKQRSKSVRCARSCRCHAWSCSKSAKGAALPTRGKKHLIVAHLRASSDAGAAARPSSSQGLRRGIVPFCAVRVISTIKRGARNCLKHSNARTLPSRLAGGLRTPCSSFISRRRPELRKPGASRASGKQRSKSARCARSCRHDA